MKNVALFFHCFIFFYLLMMYLLMPQRFKIVHLSMIVISNEWMNGWAKSLERKKTSNKKSPKRYNNNRHWKNNVNKQQWQQRKIQIGTSIRREKKSFDSYCCGSELKKRTATRKKCNFIISKQSIYYSITIAFFTVNISRITKQKNKNKFQLFIYSREL